MSTSILKIWLSINHFENSPKQLLIFLDELIKLGRIKALYVGVKNERKDLANKKLVEFLFRIMISKMRDSNSRKNQSRCSLSF